MINAPAPVKRAAAPTRGLRRVAWAAAAWCVGFAAVNLIQDASGRFDHGALVDYAAGLAVMGWLVVALKLLGAAAALLTVHEGPRWVPAPLRLLLIWGAFALLALYSAGNLVEAGYLLITNPGLITGRSLGYVAFFLAGAAAFGALAVSYRRRTGQGRRLIIVGVVGAPVLLGLLLVVAPAILAAAGLLPG
ncbi:hypothetical protein [Microlunatus speluncae]|uniref:hypothetical protein n=1 Tax=Microlunatus speluncae TaxID=2594267 RepID=UPI00126676A5|nr:hypothetical protein [Microlunatus speluncae]